MNFYYFFLNANTEDKPIGNNEMLMIFVTDKNLQCSVCMDDFKLDEETRKLPCNHRYHNDCIVPWLELVSNYDKLHLPSPQHQSLSK